MFSMTLFLSHFVSDFAFTNVYSDKFLEKSSYYKHLIWVLLVFLAFNFDMLTGWMLLIVSLSILLHIGIDLLRIKNQNTNIYFEIIFLGAFLIWSYLFRSFFQDSFLSNVFQFYIVGMIVTTSFGSFLFRTFNLFEKEKKDTIGASERLAIFIFMMAQNYLWSIIAVGAGLAYKLIFVKEKNIKELILSPTYAILVSLFWYLLMQNIF